MVTPERLREYRGLNFLTQTQLADLLGMSLRQICAYENGDLVTPEPVQRLFLILEMHTKDGEVPTWWPSKTT